MSAAPVLIVAIDGPSGVGKSTVARGVAARLRLPYFDTGAMYRALGRKVLDEGLDPEDRRGVEALARAVRLDCRLDADGGMEVLLDGEPVGDRIRSPEVSQATSRIAVHPAVRERLVELQRRWAGRQGAVMEGRDIGTQVFPDTPYKYFLEASIGVRIARRMRQLEEAGGGGLDNVAVAAEVTERDRRDSGRELSPLTRDPSYTVIDTSRIDAAGVIERIVSEVRGRSATPRRGC